MLALSVRQPWAWLIVNSWKPIENRDWKWPATVRGRILIHASKGMTHKEYEDCEWFMVRLGVYAYTQCQLPRFDNLERGGIVGDANLVDCVTEHDSIWFTGPRGLVLDDAHTRPFMPYKGRLGFFDVPEITA